MSYSLVFQVCPSLPSQVPLIGLWGTRMRIRGSRGLTFTGNKISWFELKFILHEKDNQSKKERTESKD